MVARNDKTSRPHGGENFAGAIVYFIAPFIFRFLPLYCDFFFGLAFLFTRNTSTWEVRKTKITSSRLAHPVSGPSHKDCDATYMLTAFSCTAYIYRAYLTERGEKKKSTQSFEACKTCRQMLELYTYIYI